MMRFLLSYLCAGVLLATAPPAMAQFAKTELTAGMHRIEADVALDYRGRAQGLMNRKAMAPHKGMLFAFPEAAVHCMWMKNTYIPLSVAFLDQEGRILNIEDMSPHTEDSHCAARPARYALEMNLGWFRQRGLKAGDQIRGVSGIKAAAQ